MPDYPSERALVEDFVQNLRLARTPWRCMSVATEFSYQRGRTDVIALDDRGNILAFEAKLSRWRVALQQAYRNTCFANRSYVLLPRHVALHASRFLSEFERRRVGICYVDADTAHILQEAHDVDPVQPWLACRAVASMTTTAYHDSP